MKKILLFMLFIGLITVGGFYYYSTKEAPPAKFPDFLTGSDKLIFEQIFSDTWAEIGLRPGFIATVQSQKLLAIDENGKEVQFKRNDNVGFKSWNKEGEYFVYKFSFGSKSYSHKSKYPFELFYGVRSSKIENWKNLWGYRSKNEKENFKFVYNSIADNMLRNVENEELKFEWLRNLEKKYRSNLNKSLITPSKWGKFGLNSKQFFKFKYQLADEEITPVMIKTFKELGNNSLIYVHRPKGVRLYDKNFKPFKSQRTQPYFDETEIKDTPFRFKGYKVHDSQRYIAASFNGSKLIYIKVSFFDDVLPIKPSAIKYETIVSDIISDRSPNCDEIVLGFVYLDRQLHYNLINNPNSPIRFKSLISKLSSKSNECVIGIIGPKKTINIHRTSQNDFIVYQSKKIKIRPDPIVRAYYNNLDFLIPAWCNYNSKGEKQQKTGIRPTNDFKKFPSGYITWKGKYTVEVPNLRELLSNADLSKILTGHGIEKIVFDTATSIAADNNHDFRSNLERKAKTKENAAIFYTKFSYKSIAQSAYRHENFTTGEIDIIAKGLREFNNLLRDKNKLSWVGGSKVKIYKESETPQNVVVPVEIEQLGLERRPIKANFKYKFKMKDN